ncbi:MAG: hypothetical protein SFV23_20465, partial [Planctomycetaceae bacterium]|nr:hypothetical protein [Planctomycetaceae bacterium]
PAHISGDPRPCLRRACTRRSRGNTCDWRRRVTSGRQGGRHAAPLVKAGGGERIPCALGTRADFAI